MKKILFTKPWILIAGIAAVTAVGAIVLIAIGRQSTEDVQEESYRTIQVYDLDGKAIIDRESVGSFDAMENLFLESGDKATTDVDSWMRLKLDEDKYILTEENTVMQLTATGTKKDSKTTIHLLQGAVTNEIQNKLSENSSYEVTTPNAVMAVRGTVFRVEVWYDENGTCYTRLYVFSGKVGSRLISPEGEVLEDELIVEAGYQVTVEGTSEYTKYLGDPEKIDYSKLPKEVLKMLLEIYEDGTDIVGITEDELIALINGSEDDSIKVYTIRYLYNGNVFGTQKVVEGGKAKAPKLSPQPGGTWDFDFNTEIHEDTSINWK